ncbi:MAG: hypothetical protein EBY32_07765 [Proteobacteria bacterium]|nr:hypothetical protein [Pseudomonadota bacterium]
MDSVASTIAAKVKADLQQVESKWSRHSTRKAGDGQDQPCFKNCAICQKNMRKALWRFFNGP